MTAKIEDYDPTKIDAWRPSCPFCHAPWTDDMIVLEGVNGASGCPTCGADPAGASIEIHCHACKKLIYMKEVGGW